MLRTGDTVGIIGGGQLGRMLAMAAARLGLKCVILDPDVGAPAAQCANRHIVSEYDDKSALRKLADECDVITYEFENVDLDAIRALEADTPCHPNPVALETSQDRLVEKRFFKEHGIETAPFFPVEEPSQIEALLVKCGGSGILKTRRFGYDGKGQVRLGTGREASLAEAMELAGNVPCILEGLVPFEREVSIIAARNGDGDIACFDVAENVHSEGILRSSSVPAAISQVTTQSAHAVAGKILSALDYVGVIGIEFFVMNDGSLIANEYAPRVHNSGHWTEAACVTSQFEQHVRAISGFPLGDTKRHSDCRMENLIGDEIDLAPQILSRPGAMLHLYGKSETRDGRKMGHFTQVVSDNPAVSES